MRLFLTLILLFTCSFQIFGQRTKTEDLLKLRNGYQFRGEVLSDTAEIIFKTRNGILLTYPAEEVKSINHKKYRRLAPAESILFREKGWYNSTTLAFPYYPSLNSTFASMHSATGYQFNRYAGIGLGVGVDISSRSDFYVPVYLQTRGYFRQGKVSRCISWMSDTASPKKQNRSFSTTNI